MRVALVHPFAWPEVRRGAERYLADLAWYLGDRGHVVDVITGTEGTTRVDVNGRITTRRRRHLLRHRFAEHGVTATETFALRALGPLLRRRYDVVHALTPTAAVSARVAGQRTVYTALGHPSQRVLSDQPLQRKLIATAVRAAHVTTALSEAAASEVAAVFGHRPTVLPPGVRLERFAPDLRPRRGPPRVLFSADLSQPQKGLDVLLAAAARLLDRVPSLRVQLSGPGDPTWALERLGPDRGPVVAALDLLALGDLEDIPGRYRAASITALPSTHEAFGLALVESLAAGTPVVCSDAGGMPEIVGGDVGRVVPYGDALALAAGIEAVLELASKAGTPAHCANHARRWGWVESVGPAHEALYLEVARRPAGGGLNGSGPRIRAGTKVGGVVGRR